MSVSKIIPTLLRMNFPIDRRLPDILLTVATILKNTISPFFTQPRKAEQHEVQGCRHFWSLRIYLVVYRIQPHSLCPTGARRWRAGGSRANKDNHIPSQFVDDHHLLLLSAFISIIIIIIPISPLV